MSPGPRRCRTRAVTTGGVGCRHARREEGGEIEGELLLLVWRRLQVAFAGGPHPCIRTGRLQTTAHGQTGTGGRNVDTCSRTLHILGDLVGRPSVCLVSLPAWLVRLLSRRHTHKVVPVGVAVVSHCCQVAELKEARHRVWAGRSPHLHTFLAALHQRKEQQTKEATLFAPASAARRSSPSAPALFPVVPFGLSFSSFSCFFLANSYLIIASAALILAPLSSPHPSAPIAPTTNHHHLRHRQRHQRHREKR